jgi:hypothetical protein
VANKPLIQEEILRQPTYDKNQIEYINIPVIPYKVSAELPTIKNPPPINKLPTFVYELNPTTGNLERYLVTTDDNSDQDRDYGIEQQWLLFNRQGDQYDRVSEWNPDPEPASREYNNELGYSMVNEGMVWGPLPKTNPVASRSDPEYRRLLEYQRTQEEEEDNS